MNTMTNLDRLDLYLLSKSKLSLIPNEQAKVNEHELKRLKSSTIQDPAPCNSGEIFRTEDGKFVMLCKYCDAVCANLQEMMDHISLHFDKKKSTKHQDIETAESPLPLPEFISTDEISIESEMMKTTVTLNDCKYQNLVSGKHHLKPLKEPSISKTNFQMASTKSLEIGHTGDKSTSSPTRIVRIFKLKRKPPTKIVKIVKLKRIKIPACNKTNAKKFIVSEQKSGFGTPEFAKIKMSSEIKLKPVVTDLRSKKCVPSNESTQTEQKDYVHVTKRKRYSCYQCEMEPRIYEVSEPRRHICLFCPIWFPNHVDFEFHVSKVHNKNPNYVMCKDFYCYVCERKFDFRHHLTRHLNDHKETADHLCAICGACFKAKYQLTVHMRIHVDKTFECDVCGKKFKLFARLRKHLWCHNTNLSFVCKICSKGFKMKTYLRKHMALHDEPKIHCRICDASFHFVSVRRAHEKSVHNVV